MAKTKSPPQVLVTLPPAKRRENTKWSDGDDRSMLDDLIDAKARGQATENGFKPRVYTRIAKRLQARRTLGGVKTISSIKTRIQTVSTFISMYGTQTNATLAQETV